MGKGLHTLGQTMFRLKWWIVGAWLLIIAVLGLLMLNFGGTTSSSLSIPGTQAQKTLDRFKELFPDTGSTSASVVIEAPSGKKITDYKDQVNALTKTLSTRDNVTTAISPYDNPAAISKDQTIGFITLQLEDVDGMVPTSTIETVRKDMSDAQTDGLTIAAGGSLVDKQLGEILGIGEVSGVILALIVLVITLGSLVAAGLPIITALITVGVSMTGLFALSNVIELSNTAPVLAVMLGLAVGIDYSLFIINRYRTFVKEGYALNEAAGRAIATAGNAVLFAAATVVIALAALSVVQIPFMTVMGLAAAATVALAAIVTITLMPAIFGIAKLRLFSRKERKAIIALEKSHTIKEQRLDHSSVWYRIGETLLKYRKSILFSAVVLIGVIAIPATHLQMGLPTDETAAKGSSGRIAYDLLEKGFGAGYNGQLLVVVEGLPKATDEDKTAVRAQIMQQYQKQLQAQMQQQASTGAPVLPPSPEAQKAAMEKLNEQVEQYATYASLQKVAEGFESVTNVASAQAALTTDNGTKGIIQITPKFGPSDEETKELVAYLRDEDNQKRILNNNSASYGITGSTALQIDINNKLSAALPVYLAVVVGLSLLLLMVAFRSILIPVKATLGFLLSVIAMFGALVAIFQWGWFGIAEAPGPIVSFIPIIAIGILFGLAMDYEFFLVSGMQEAYHEKKDARRAVVRGFALGSRVVVAAGFIMVSVFAGFIGNHDSTIQSIGFALALGIFVDAFIVRMIIVPIIMSYLGKAAWWMPQWLRKRLPNISIEGDA